MSWLFSQALVEAYSPDASSDGEQSAQLNVMPTQHKFSRNDKTMEFSRLSQFGLTCAVLTADRGEAVLTSFLEDFPVRTSALQDGEQESTESAPASGQKWRASFARYSRDTCSWKTHQLSLLGGLTEYSETWPKWGLMRNGECWERHPWEPLTNGSASGLWPTPTASAYKGWSANHNRAHTDDRLDYTVEREAAAAGQTGRLNPEWVEWLMGWPIEWTALEPLGMDRYREWLQQHSPNYQSDLRGRV